MELLTVDETAKALKVSKVTVRRYIASGRLPAVRIGRGVRVRRDAIDRALTPVALPEDEADPLANAQPFTMDDPLWNIVGMGETDEPTNITELKDEYLADAFAATHE